MGKYDSEQTRRYLLNESARGSLEEIVSNEADPEENADFLCGDDCGDQERLGNQQFMKEWEGRVQTHAYFRQSYE
ncbi:hypothetical protein EHV15_14115 [Paenibacillus oralis]|uniref:Uncharacterized protein n=1 Tax=Paenibacillus oralis TaxID=2490856 RepID=A0A3P3U2S3_9BACL|nr:hypothetical protein [Paenibacillus oralis]RRJ63939.1 hypothetical protein EHV15_14115 [Paenibacillus oralis]